MRAKSGDGVGDGKGDGISVEGYRSHTMRVLSSAETLVRGCK